jgi:hypothetical protein
VSGPDATGSGVTDGVGLGVGVGAATAEHPASASRIREAVAATAAFVRTGRT